MPTIYDWSLSPGDNATADTDINWSEGQFPSTVNDSARQMMARQAEWLKDNGVLAAAGNGNVITIATNSKVTNPPHGMTLAFKANATNTGAVTLGINGGSGLKLRKIFAGDTDAVDLDAGDITAKGVYVVHFDSGANAGAGAWILINPTNLAEMQNLISSNLNNAPIKTTPDDADGVVITDSEDSGKTKRVLWSRIKAVLEAYFNTSYLRLTGGTLTGPIFATTLISSGQIQIPEAMRILRANDDNVYIQTGDGTSGSFKPLNFTRWLQDIPIFRINENNVDFKVPAIGVTPTSSTHLTTKGYVDTQVNTRVSKSGDTMTGRLSVNGISTTGTFHLDNTNIFYNTSTGNSVIFFRDGDQVEQGYIGYFPADNSFRVRTNSTGTPRTFTFGADGVLNLSGVAATNLQGSLTHRNHGGYVEIGSYSSTYGSGFGRMWWDANNRIMSFATSGGDTTVNSNYFRMSSALQIVYTLFVKLT